MTQKIFQKMMRELAPLRGLDPFATPGYIKNLARQIWILETTGATHFGGPDILAWYLVKRVRDGEDHMRLTTYFTQLWAERMRI